METSYLGEIKQLRTVIKEKQKELHQKENFLESLLTSMDDLVFVLDPNGNFENAFYNEINKEALYKPEEEFIGRHHNEVMPQHTHADFNAAFSLLLKTRKPQRYEYKLDMRDGAEWYEARLSPIKNTITDFAGVVAVVRNITHQKAALNILMREKTKLELVTENLGAGLLVISKDLTVLWTNKVIGSKYGKCVGKKCSMFGCSDKVKECPTMRLFKTGSGREEAKFDDSSDWDRIISTPVIDYSGEVIAALELITFKNNK